VNQSQLTLHLLAVAERIDGPESWVHLCVTAAEEAASVVGGGPPPRLRDEDRKVLAEMLGQDNTKKPAAWLIEKCLSDDTNTIPAVKIPPFYTKDMLRRSLTNRLNAHQSGAIERALAVQTHETAAAAHEAAAGAYRVTLPAITNRRSVQSFVACVAAGVLRGYITAKDANALLVAANAALSAHPKRTKTRK